MHRYRVPMLLALLLVFAFVPHLSFAASFNGPIIPVAIQTCAAGWQGLVTVVGLLVQFAISLGIIIFVLVFAYAGFLWVLNPTNPENRSAGRKMLINAAIGLVITLASWLIVNTILNALGYTGGGIQGATSALFGTGDLCIQPHTGETFGGGTGTTGLGTTANPNVPLSSTGTGACDASEVQQGATTGGYTLTSSQADTLACIAKYESSCGAMNQNYNWGKGSSAYGAFQVTLQGNSSCYDNTACEQAVGASGPLDCSSGFSGGNPIPGSPVVARCQQAASNLNCSASAAACLLQHQSMSQAYASDPNSAGQQACIRQYGG